MGSKKLNILFVSADKFPPYRVDVSVLFGKEIVGKGHTVDWILQSGKPLDRTMETDLHGGRAVVGASADNLSLFNRVKSLLLGILLDFKIFSVMKAKRYDILLVKDKFISGLLAVIAARINNAKFIYWLSFPFAEDSFFRVKERTVRLPLLYWLRGLTFHLLLYQFILKACDHAFVQTEYMKRTIVEQGIPAHRMTAVPMAVSLKDVSFIGYACDTASTKKPPMVVYLGTLVKIRRMEFLLRSFALVLEKKADARLYLVGGSEIHSDEEDLRREAADLNIEHAVTITGFLPQPDAWRYVEAADVCVSPIYPSPSFDVGSPTKLLEYMAMGKASVANDHPEQQVVLAESRAGICVPYEETAFAEAILYLLDNPDIASQMGIRGRHYIAERRNYEMTAELVENELLRVNG